MRRLQYARATGQDLDEIWLFIARGSPAAADRFIAEIHRHCRQLAEFPGLGHRRPELKGELRVYPFGEYVVFYREITDGIQITRILHGARDLPPDLRG